MQISEKMGQYNRNVTNGTEELRGAQGVQKMVSSVRDMAAGSVFEGTVNTVRNGKVVLALGNGQVLSARLDGKVGIAPGSSMFFQVKSNDGTTISIRPYTGAGNAGNPILLNALTAAGVPVTERSLTMVDAMMREQMPIGRSGILDMVKVLGNNPGANVETLVQMTKLGTPVTEEMAAQFENYMTDRHAILDEMELFTGQLTEVLGDAALPGEDAFDIYSRILKIFQSKTGGWQGMETTFGSISGQGSAQKPAAEGGFIEELAAEGVNQSLDVQNEEYKEGLSASQTVHAENGWNQEAQPAGEPIVNLLSGEQLKHLTKLLLGVPTLVGSPAIFTSKAQEEIFVDTMPDEDIGQPAGEQIITEEAVLNKDLTAGQFLKAIQNTLAENSQYGFTGISKLFRGKEFQIILKNMIQEQWMIKPQELKSGSRISALYEKMEDQMKQVETAMRMAGMSQNSFTHTAAEIRSNIEFMNQVNQLYTYVQIPLKMSGQNANGELYVYTNKKQMSDPDAELTAFLHLDLENLGSTDVSVKMQRKNVTTNFYMSDNASYNLLEKHFPILEKRLKNKGYSCKITVVNERKKVNFVENFLQKGMPQAGTLHRYSFDVRA